MQNNHNNSPDYSQYTIEELKDVIAHIDKAQFPERFDAANMALSEKLKTKPQQPRDDEERNAVIPPLKWSEQHVATRVIMILFFAMLILGLVGMFCDFMVAKRWSSNSVGLFGLLSISLIVLWFTCLTLDEKFSKRLTLDWRGKLSLIVMPLLFLMLSWIFVDKTLPFGLHKLAEQQNVRVDMDYKKRNGRKHCRHRIKIIETRELEDIDLCLTKEELNRLPDRGKLSVLGTQSRFGLHVDEFSIATQRR
ncbi:hypothetical protein [Alteromonas sp. A079]|uniref:hypothetical protein n=1 Tax=Alteromonas sp. A079 TaxID=3410268 RepID=UPI003BA02FA2